MLKQIKLFFTLLCFIQAFWYVGISSAENMLIDANILYAIPSPDVDADTDFHTGKILNLNFNYYTYPWLALTAGVYTSEEIFEDISADNVGRYQTSLEMSGLTLAVRPEHKFSERNKVYGRLGILFYKTTLNVGEYFEPGRPSGVKGKTANGNGYLFSVGWAHNFTQKVSFQMELYNQTQLDLFSDSSKKGFNLNNTGFTLGQGYAF